MKNKLIMGLCTIVIITSSLFFYSNKTEANSLSLKSDTDLVLEYTNGATGESKYLYGSDIQTLKNEIVDLKDYIDIFTVVPANTYYYVGGTEGDSSRIKRYVLENGKYYACDENGVKIRNIPETPNPQTLKAYSGIDAGDISAGSAGFVNKRLLLGNGSDNIAYYNRGVAAGELKSKVGTATADKVLSGYTFTNAAGVGIAGTMVNRGILNWNPTSNTTQTIQPGYYSGGTLNSAGAYNAGVAKGAADSRVGTATADKVLTGYTFTNSAGAGIAGTMVNRGTLNWNPDNGTTYTVQPGYYSGGTLDSSGAYNAGIAFADNRVDTNNKSYIEGVKAGKDAITIITINTPVWTDYGGVQTVNIQLVKQSDGRWKNVYLGGSSGDAYGSVSLE